MEEEKIEFPSSKSNNDSPINEPVPHQKNKLDKDDEKMIAHEVEGSTKSDDRMAKVLSENYNIDLPKKEHKSINSKDSRLQSFKSKSNNESTLDLITTKTYLIDCKTDENIKPELLFENTPNTGSIDLDEFKPQNRALILLDRRNFNI